MPTTRLPYRILLLWLIALALFGLLRRFDAMMADASRRHEAHHTILDLEFAGRQFDPMLATWRPTEKDEVDGVSAARRSLWADFAFIIAYVALLHRIGRRLGWPERGRLLRAAAWAPWIAGLLDGIENGCLLFAIGRWISIGTGGTTLPWIAMCAASARFTLLAAWLIAFLTGNGAQPFRAIPRAIPYLFLARVPLIGLSLIAAAPFVMPGSSLLANLVLLDTWWQLALVGFVLGITSLACVATAVLAIRYAPLRCSTIPLLRPAHADVPHACQVTVALSAAMLLAASLSLDDPIRYAALPFACTLAGMLLGTGLIVALQRGLDRARAVCAAPLPAACHERYDGRAFGGYRYPPANGDHDDARVRAARPAGPRWLCWIFGRLQHILPGHVAAAVSFATLLGLYVIAVVFLDPGDTRIDSLPVLADVLFIIALSVSLLSGAAFFLDRHRVPLTLVVLLWTVILGRFTRSTHYFEVEQHDPGQQQVATLPTPGDLVERAVASLEATADTQHDPKRLILVCAAGGGIQAAGWTAKVLTTLDATDDPTADPTPACALDFRDRLVFVSGVSGGSVGAMHYLEARRRKGRLTADDRDQVVQAAMASSLNAVGWALAFKDLRRPLGLFIDRSMDRSMAMEAVWARLFSKQPGDRPDPTLADWVTAAANGSMPGACLNATLSGVGQRPDKGQRLLFSSVDLKPDGRGHGTGFFDLYQHGDVRVTTAARLSATFPYVTPMARAATRNADGNLAEIRPTHYVADGGYFDNLGFVTALEFMQRARNADPDLRFAIVVIQSFPDAKTTPHDPQGAAWANALLGPLDLLLATSNTTQLTRMQAEQSLLSNDRVFSFVFESAPGSAAPPLSWHLSKTQQRDIEHGFGARNNAMLARLCDWLKG